MLFFSGALLLAGAWYLVITRSKNSKNWNVLVPLLAGTFSHSFAPCLAAPSALGHSYSNTRYIIIDANFVVALLAALVAFTRFKMDGILIGV
jgi:hypothetical protein